MVNRTLALASALPFKDVAALTANTTAYSVDDRVTTQDGFAYDCVASGGDIVDGGGNEWVAVLIAAAQSDITPARNLALDPIDTTGDGMLQGGGTMPNAVAAPSDMVDEGIINARSFGAGTTVSALYRREQLLPLPLDDYLFCGAYVYSTSGTDWQASSMACYLYSVSSGGSIVASLSALETGYVEITSNLRFYYGRFRVPTSGTFVSAAYGFNNVVSGTVAYVGGWVMAQSQNTLRLGSVDRRDWTGWYSRDDWRDTSQPIIDSVADKADASVVDALAATVLRTTSYRNLIDNPNNDPDEDGIDTINATPVWSTPAADELVAVGVGTSLKIGGGGSNVYPRQYVLGADSSGKHYFASVYVYSANGTTWPNITGYWYTTGTVYGGALSSMSYEQVSSNLRLYYSTGQWAARSDMVELRIGQTSTPSGADVQIGGYTYVEHTETISLHDVMRRDWYPQYTEQSHLVETARKADTAFAAVKPFTNKVVAYFGDSVTESFGVPAALQELTGGTVHNFGFGGCRWCPNGSSGAEGYKSEMSQVRIAAMIESGVFTDLTDAADDLFALNGDDNRTQAAAIAALDWSTVDYILMDWGTNDWSAGKDLGAATSTDENEINGAINLTVSRILGAYPNAQLVIVTPWWRGPDATLGDSNINPNGDGVYLSDYQDAMAERGRYHQTHVMPMHELCGISLANKDTFLSDDLHPTQPAGRDRKAKVLSSWLRANFG